LQDHVARPFAENPACFGLNVTCSNCGSVALSAAFSAIQAPVTLALRRGMLTLPERLDSSRAPRPRIAVLLRKRSMNISGR